MYVMHACIFHHTGHVRILPLALLQWIIVLVCMSVNHSVILMKLCALELMELRIHTWDGIGAHQGENCLIIRKLFYRKYDYI